jgi:iron(III) transport system substrate-binding protein
VKRTFLLAIFAFLTFNCSSDQKSENILTIYTSLYPEVIAIMKAAAAKEMPDIELEFLQLGSELVAARVNTELAAGGTKADIIMTSDPFWYHELKKAGHLEPYDAPYAREVPTSLRDPENYWVTNRIPLMAIAFNKNADFPAPATLSELADPKYHGKITMGDPLKSGTNFTTIAVLAKKYGWEFIEKLKANEIMSSGGNSATLRRVESMEYPIGIVLLENLLAARRKNTDVEIIYPQDLLIPIPSPIAILKSTKNLEAAKRFYDFAFSEAGQKAMIEGYMYSPLPGFDPPAGAKSWQEISGSMFAWDDALIDEIGRTREEIKQKFMEIMQRE